MPACNYTQTVVIGGVTITGTISPNEEGQISQVASIPAAKAGTLTTRTDANTGEVTLGANHGIQTADKVDVYWAGGLRYGVTVGTVNVNVVPIDLGAGDDLPDTLPTLATPVTVCKQKTVTVAVDGDLLAIFAASSSKRGHIDVQEAGGTSIVALELAAGAPNIWTSASDLVDNPIAGHVVGKVMASNGDASAAAELRIGFLYDSVA